jgi:acyl-CoA synthetase (AMP-forming)/AMP-acid ligase II
MNIVDPIAFQAKMNPEGPAICAPGTALDTITYGRLGRWMNNIGRMALARGLAPGNLVALSIKDKIFHAAIILGLARVGIVTVSGRNQNLPKELPVDAVIADGPHPFGNLNTILADPTWTMGDGKPIAEERAYRAGGEDICRIILTSGTTGEAKAVAFSHGMLAQRIAHYDFAKGNRFSHASRLYCDLGIGTAPGFRYMLYMLWKGGTIYFYGEDPESTLQAFDLHKIQNMVASPHGLAEYVKFYDAHSAFQCGFDHIISSGGLLSKALSERTRARMCTNLFSSYGATEAGTVAFAPAQVIAEIPGAVGYVVPGVSVEIVNDSDQILPIGKEGVVRIRSPNLVAGYMGNPGQSANSFRNGCFYPGDIGYLTRDRMLVISGREETRLNLGGDKVNPETIEEVVTSFSRIEEAAVFSAPNELGIEEVFAMIVSSAAVDEAELRAHCEKTLPDAFVPVRFFSVDRLPRSEMGKIERHLLLELARSKLH